MAKFVPAVVSTDRRDAKHGLPAKHGQSVFPFYLMLHPTGWNWDTTGKRWVPRTGKLHITPGAGGTPDKAKGKPYDTRHLILNAQQDGWVVLTDQESYLRSLPLEEGGVIYITAWDTPEVFYDEVDWDHDAQGYGDFLLSKTGDLSTGALIKPMPRRLKERKIRTFGKRVERLETSHLSTPGNQNIKARLDAARKTMAEMQQDYDGVTNGRETGPKSSNGADATVPRKAQSKDGSAKGKGNS